MLEFHSDERLQEQVGATSAQILSCAGAEWPGLFESARRRLADLAARRDLSQALIFERDRLASYFGCAFGPQGLLARCGALFNLRERLARIGTLAPRLVEDEESLARLRREALIARTFAREWLGKLPAGPEEVALLESVCGACRSAIGFADFCLAATAIDRDRGGFKGLALWAASDLASIAASGLGARPLWTALAFALGRAGDQLSQGAPDPSYEALLQAQLASLKSELWEASEQQLAREKAPAPLSVIVQADRELEALLATLADARKPSNARARLVGELLARLAAAKAWHAAELTGAALQRALLVLLEGLAAETKRGAP